MQMQGIFSRIPVLSSFAVKDEYRYWVYIVASKTGTLCTGMTGDLYTCIMQHKAGEHRRLFERRMDAIDESIRRV